MWTYDLENKCFKDFAFGKSDQADSLFSSYLAVFLCYSEKLDKEQKFFNEFGNKEFIGDIAKSPLRLSWRESQAAVGWGVTGRWAGEYRECKHPKES